VAEASVRVDGAVVGSIGRGLLVLCGVAAGDTLHDAAWLARKTVNLRIFDDADGKLNRSLAEAEGAVLAVSQFTLYGDAAKGNRPSYIEAAPPDEGERGYEAYLSALRELGARVETGRFRANMQVVLVNDGPVTLLLESRGRSAP